MLVLPRRWTRAVLAAPVLIGLWGCPYESSAPLGSPAEVLDPRLLGDWRCAAHPDDPPGWVRFVRFDDRQYYVEAEGDREETTRFRTFPARLAGVPILNVQELKEGEDDRPYSFLRYSLDGATLRLEALRKEPLAGAVSPAAVAEILERRRDDPELYEGLLTCTRSPDRARGPVEVEARRIRAMLQHDTAALEPILADELVYVHTTGDVDTKASFLESIASGRRQYLSVDRDDVLVRVSGKTAVVTGRAAMRIKVGGKDLAFSIRFTDVYVNDGARWQMVAWQSTRLPDR